jgi:UDP-N-acetyl-D-mannosaminuronic acid dehydrogenase
LNILTAQRHDTSNTSSIRKYTEIPTTQTQFHNVIVIGLGQLGLAVARWIKRRGFNTYGFDINTKAMEIAESTAGIKQVTNFRSDGFDVYVISVSTHKPDDMFSPQIDGLLSIADKISREANKDGALVSIESTIPRGTSMKVFEKLNHRLHVVHAPHRWYALEQEEHGINQPRVIGGVSECCLRAGMHFYAGGASTVGGMINNTIATQSITISPNSSPTSIKSTQISSLSPVSLKVNKNNNSSNTTNDGLGIPMHPVSNIEIAETTKIVENAHRYLQIAFAEDLYLYCQENNINFPELREALNTKWNVNILEPREGIGGHCLPKDTKMFLQSSKSIRSKILRAAMEVDEDYRTSIKSSLAKIR